MFICYVYERSGECIAQIEDLVGIEIEHEMSDISSASISIFHDNPYANRSILKKMNKVVIRQKIWSQEFEMFSGIIRGIQASLEIVKIVLNDELWILSRRLTHNAYEYRNERLEVILKRIWSDINAVAPLGLEFVCSAPDLVPKKSYGKKTTLLSILKDWKEKGYEFRLFGSKLVFWKKVGRDRTQGEFYKEYSYDTRTPDNNTILKASVLDDAQEIINGVGDENNIFSKYQESIDEYGFLEESVSLEGKSAEDFLQEAKNGTQVFEIEGKVDNFFEVEIWDIVKVFIHRNNDLMNYDGSMEVVEKKYVWGDLPKISYKFSSAKIWRLSFIKKLQKMEERIKKLEQK